MSDLELQIQLLNKKMDKILQILSADEDCRSLTLKQFTAKIGISTYKLRNLYKIAKLPIPAPYRVDNKDPKYSQIDVKVVRDFLNNSEDLKF